MLSLETDSEASTHISIQDAQEMLRPGLLAELGVLDSAPDAGFDALTRTAAAVTQCPVALLSLTDGERQWFKSRVGIDINESPRRWAFCATAILEAEPLVVQDARLDPRFADNPFVTGEPHVRFYAGCPLTIDGVRIGTLCVVDMQPRRLGLLKLQSLTSLAETAQALLESGRHKTRSVEQMRRLTDFAMVSGDWLWETDQDHRVTWMSSAYASNAAFPEPWSVDRRISDGAVLTTSGEPVEPALTLHSLFDQRRQFAGAVIRSELAGECRYVWHSALCLADEEGAWQGYRGIARDITAQVQAEKSARAQHAAEKAAEARGELISRVSHELRTPLNAILGFAQLSRMNAAAQPLDKTLNAVHQIEHAGAHLLSLVDDMLDLARLDAEQSDLSPRPVAMVPLLERVLGLLTPHARRHGVTITESLDPKTHAAVADIRATKQVIFNLVGNAIKFAGPGSTVRVSLRNEPSGERVAFDVADDGPGISTTRLATLFEPFMRTDSGRTSAAGSGLGLSISRKLVEAMGGELTVVSRLGHGATFTVRLPADGPPEDADVEHFVASSEDVAFVRAVGAAVVLYIEDDPVNALLMQQCFESMPSSEIKLLLAATGREGLRQALHAPPDLILLDMNLPDLDGHQVFRRLRQEPRTASIPVIAVSADALPEQIHKALADGMDDYWTKPLDLQGVRSKLTAFFCEDELRR